MHIIRKSVADWSIIKCTTIFYAENERTCHEKNTSSKVKVKALFIFIGLVSLNEDCFHHFCMNNIPVAQMQIASLVEELLSLRMGFFTFDCDNFILKSDSLLLFC